MHRNALNPIHSGAACLSAFLLALIFPLQGRAQSFTFTAEHTTGSGSGRVSIMVLDPALTTGDDYEVTFPSAELFTVTNLTTQNVVVSEAKMGEDSPVFDGLQITATGLPAEIREILEISYNGNAVAPPVHVFRPGDSSGEGGENSTGEFTFVGAGATGGLEDIARSQANTMFNDYEIRFDGNPEGRNKLVYSFAGLGTIDVPFSVWNIGQTPDDPADDYQVLVAGFDDSGNYGEYDGGAVPRDGGPGTMYDRLYVYEFNDEPSGDLNGDGTNDYDDFLLDLENNSGDLSQFFFSRPYFNGPASEIIARLCLVGLTEDEFYIPPAATTIRITTSKPLTSADVFAFTAPDFGLYTLAPVLNFGNVRVGESRTLPLLLANSSSAPTKISNIIADEPDFAISPASLTIAAGDTVTVDITFSPGEAALITTTLTISSDDLFYPEYQLQVQGEGLPNTAGPVKVVGHISIADDGTVSDVWGYYDENTSREYALVGRLLEFGVTIIDVTDPSLPRVVARIDEVPGFDVKAWGNYMYSVTGGGGLNQGGIVDISDPENPLVVGNFNSSHNITITDDGYMVLEVPGLRIMDLNPDPTSPQLLWEGGVQGHDASVIDGILYDFHGSAGTFIYDFANPADPQIITAINDPQISYNHSGWTSKDNRYLYICDELASTPSSDIVIYDISDLNNPVRVGGISDSTATVHNLYVLGDLLYASYYSAGFKVFDVSDPANPVLFDHFDTSPSTGETFSGAWGVYPFAPSGRIYISDRESGLYVFEVDDGATNVEEPAILPTVFALHHNYPNPFNPETTIRYDLASESEVRLSIYNTLGQHVRTLEDNHKAPGSYQVTWDGRDDNGAPAASGVYFYRLKTADFVQTHRMLLLR